MKLLDLLALNPRALLDAVDEAAGDAVSLVAGDAVALMLKALESTFSKSWVQEDTRARINLLIRCDASPSRRLIYGTLD